MRPGSELPATELHRLLYVSRALIDPCSPQPRAILDVATRRNAALDMTGLLCFSGEHFAQILERPTAALDTLMTSIRCDARHRMLREWPAEKAVDGQRFFPGWSMGYAADACLDRAMGQLVLEPHGIPLDTVAHVLFAGLDLYRAPRQA